MKTAISIPNDVFRAAETLAGRLGVSRSTLYAHALGEYLRKHRDEAVTRLLNEVYAKTPSTLDPVLGKLQRRAIRGTR